MNYLLTYKLKDNPTYDFEEEFSNLRTVMQRAYSIQENGMLDGSVMVYDPEGLELVEIY